MRQLNRKLIALAAGGSAVMALGAAPAMHASTTGSDDGGSAQAAATTDASHEDGTEVSFEGEGEAEAETDRRPASEVDRFNTAAIDTPAEREAFRDAGFGEDASLEADADGYVQVDTEPDDPNGGTPEEFLPEGFDPEAEDGGEDDASVDEPRDHDDTGLLDRLLD